MVESVVCETEAVPPVAAEEVDPASLKEARAQLTDVAETLRGYWDELGQGTCVTHLLPLLRRLVENPNVEQTARTCLAIRIENHDARRDERKASGR